MRKLVFWSQLWVVPVFMMQWVTLLVLAPLSEQVVTPPKSMISHEPPWTVFFQGESVILICKGFSSRLPWTTTWYSRGKVLKETQTHTLEVKEAGVYTCQADSLPQSNSVRLVFSEAPLILQAPPNVFEGESVLLNCQARPQTKVDTVVFYKNNIKLTLPVSHSSFRILRANLKDNGDYYCSGFKETKRERQTLATSNKVRIQVQELFPRPVLTASTYKPTEGSPVTLTCETQLPPQRSNIQLLFSFFRGSVALGSGQSRSPEFQIPSMQISDSGSYFCKAETTNVSKNSKISQIFVQKGIANVQIHVVPASEPVLEGQELKLICSVDYIPEPTFSWYKRDKQRWGKMIHISSKPEFKISMVKDSDAGEYYCEVRKGFRTWSSKLVTIKPQKAPVSQPVFTISPAQHPILEGTQVTLHCEVRRGSPPILYHFYHDYVHLGSLSSFSREGASFGFSLTAEHSGNYYCTAENGFIPQYSKTVNLFVIVPVSRPVLTLRASRAQLVVGDEIEFHCEALRGSPPILYTLYHKDITLWSISVPSRGGMSFKLSLTAEHSGSYFCEASNGVKAQRSDTMTLSVTIPVSRPVLILRAPKAQTVLGDVVELHCEALRGSPPILYQFYHKNVTLGSSMVSSGRGASFNLSLTTEHSGNYFCEAGNGLEIQCSEVITLKVTVPVSRPVLTLRVPRAQAVVGDEVELHCEALRGSPPILYRFYHEDVILGNTSAPSGEGASFNLSLTVEHSGNYSCEADNGLGAQRSEVVNLSITGLTENRRGLIATGVTGGLLSMVGLAAGALLFYSWLSRKAEGRAASDSSRCSSDSNTQDPTYHNVPGWIQLQPVYINVNPRGRDLVYSEVQHIQKKDKHSAASAPSLSTNKDSSVIYAQVKRSSNGTSGPQQLASTAPQG